MMRFSFILILVLSFVYLGDAEEFNFKQVKDLLRRYAIGPSSTVFKVSNQFSCECGTENYDTIAGMSDTMKTAGEYLIAYSLPSTLNCRGKLFSAYRILLNQSEVNIAICKDGYMSRDLDDCKESFNYPPDGKNPPNPTSSSPISSIVSTTVSKTSGFASVITTTTTTSVVTTTAPPNVPKDCPTGCLDAIVKIPKGEKGDKGDRGDKGDKGEKGEKGDSGGGSGSGVIGVAPSRNMTTTRTMQDLFNAFKKYTGCSMSEVDGWWYYSKAPTDCPNFKLGGDVLKTVVPTTAISSGYVIFWYGDIRSSGQRLSYVYRAKEDDLVLASCQMQLSPMFLPRMEIVPADVQCMVNRTYLNEYSGVLLSYWFVGFLGFASVFVLNFLYQMIPKMMEGFVIVRSVWRFMKAGSLNYRNEDERTQLITTFALDEGDEDARSYDGTLQDIDGSRSKS